jgi:hypothetical protein
MFEIDKDVRRPKSLLQLFAGNHLAGTFQQQSEQIVRLASEPDPHSVLPQVAALRVVFKGSEPDNPRRSG